MECISSFMHEKFQISHCTHVTLSIEYVHQLINNPFEMNTEHVYVLVERIWKLSCIHCKSIWSRSWIGVVGAFGKRTNFLSMVLLYAHQTLMIDLRSIQSQCCMNLICVDISVQFRSLGCSNCTYRLSWKLQKFEEVKLRNEHQLIDASS